MKEPYFRMWVARNPLVIVIAIAAVMFLILAIRLDSIGFSLI